MTILITGQTWGDYGDEFLTKYSSTSSQTMASDIRKIVSFLNQDHGSKRIHEIRKADIMDNLQFHIEKIENPLKSKNAVKKFIGTWNEFFKFIQHDKKLTHNHLFNDEVKDLKSFFSEIEEKFELKEEESNDPYNVEFVIKVLAGIQEKLKTATSDQKYRLFQQSIYIQLTLITGLPRKVFEQLEVSCLDNGIMKIGDYDLILPRLTKEHIDEYLKLRTSVGTGHSYLFTTVRGESLDSGKAQSLFNGNSILVEICRSVNLLSDEDSGLSSVALRNTGISEMIKTNESLYPILKLSGSNKALLQELDELYMHMYGDWKHVLAYLNKSINVILVKLPYYEKLNKQIPLK